MRKILNEKASKRVQEHLVSFNMILYGRVLPTSWVLSRFCTPWLLLGRSGSFLSLHDLQGMWSQTAQLFKVPCGRQGNGSNFPKDHQLAVWLRGESVTLRLWVECATYINPLVPFDLKTSFTIYVDLCALRFLSSSSWNCSHTTELVAL